MFALLAVYTWRLAPAALVTMAILLIVSFAGEALYRRLTGRTLKPSSQA
jgi:hypothetical protein